MVPAKRAKKAKRAKTPAPRARKAAKKPSPSPPEGTREEWYPLASDPGLHAAGIEIGVRATFKGKGSPELRIVFRRGSREAYVTCVHVAVYAGSLESLPSEAELARSSEHKKIHLAAEEHFFALNSFVAGIAEIGLRTMFTAARKAGDLPVGFNTLMQAQFLQALFNIEPAATQDLCLWVMDDAAQSPGGSKKAQDYLVPIKKVVAGNKNAPVEILARLAGDAVDEVQEAVASNITWWNCSPEMLSRLAGDADTQVRRAVAKHQKTPPETHAILAGDVDTQVRRAVAKHQNTPPETLSMLAQDSDQEVRRAVALHKHTPQEVLTRLADAAELRVRGGVACNERTPPEVLARLAKSCPICKMLGEKMYVDWDAGMNFPEEQGRLTQVMWFNDSHTLKQCPLCGTYYDFDYVTDNDYWSGQTHTAEYNRIPAEKAEQMVDAENAYRKKQKQDYRRRVRRKHGKVINTLPAVEQRIVMYLAERMYSELTKEDIAKDLGLDEHVVDAALAHLKEVKVVGSWLSTPNKFHANT